jgi:hypothetical protein
MTSISPNRRADAGRRLGIVLLVTALLPFGEATAGVDYVRDIKPLLQQRCFACHGSLKQQSDLRLDTQAFMLAGGASGPVVIAGDAAMSLLVERITAADPAVRMPPEGQPLSADQIAAIRTWINEGAAAPASEQPEKDPREHWAFQTIERPSLPASGAAEHGAHPIDRFIAAQIAEQGLTARPLAEKQVLLRRIYLDLIGLPPTTAELHAFLTDESPQAYETIVDRLLDDPRYGERWGRHWMDIWRYSDWYGRRHVPDVWNSAPQIWRWRDWIVESLNQDEGYNRMIHEMLAADEICPEDASASVATGYLVRNWYALNHNDWMRSNVEHTGKAFLGLTFNCAHCHDHKYDPLSHEDYFRFRAFFEPIQVRQDRVPGQADPGPFQEYNYSTLRKVQRLGAVSIFDKTPDAPTWFYTGGDERNRDKQRGSMPPGVPAFLSAWLPAIEPVDLPRRAWYPGLRPEIQETVLNDCHKAIASAEQELAEARIAMNSAPQGESEPLAQARATFIAATNAAAQAGQPGALAGRQSLLLDASGGRRTIHNSLSQLKSLEDGATLRFQLAILADAHVNFQLAKDASKGLTAGYVGFDKEKILSYRPSSVAEFEVGRYDFGSGQKRFEVTLVIQTNADQCLLSIRSLSDDALLVDQTPIALNGWNPIGDPTKAILFDARTGSVAAIDNITLIAPAAEPSQSGVSPQLQFDFEPPTYADGREVAGVDGWVSSALSAAPATSLACSWAANSELRELAEKLAAAERTARLPSLRLDAAEARHRAELAELKSIEACIAADGAKYGDTSVADGTALARTASRLQHDAARQRSQAEVLAQEHALAAAQAKPAEDAARAKQIEVAAKQLATARNNLASAQAALADESQADAYSPLSPMYPQTSTGRRRALAKWITHPQNPLAARVAVNHIWARHFHVPLVATVHDFGRNGALPTHPQLLDWLAVELVESGWSMKHLHRLILTSAAYRRVSSVGSATRAAAIDPENKWLWRMNAGRMESEVVRDTLLYVAGRLDLTRGGQELENSEALSTTRRSLYYSVHPEAGGKSDLGKLFDAPDALECYRRTQSIIPQQALALTNSQLVHETSAAIVADWQGKNQQTADLEDDTNRFIVAMFERILSREPSDAELSACRDAIGQQQLLVRESESSAAAVRARESLVRALLNHNDFITVR